MFLTDPSAAARRLLEEQRHHDAQARERADYFADRPDALAFADEDYLDHESWVRPALDSLGPLSGRRALDYGCGHGMAAVVLARRGAEVTAFDLSAEYVAEARRRAAANRVPVRFLCADGESLPFASASFDAIWGSAVLHHLDLHRAGAELRRVLRPGGVAVFCEPWGENPLLELARRWLPYPGKDRTRDERPLRREDLAPLRRHFARVTIHGQQLVGMARRLLTRHPGPGGWPARLDRRLLQRFPGLKRLCRYAVITLRGQ